MTVPFLDLTAQHEEIEDEIRPGLASVFARTAFVGGPEVAAFEAEYAAALGVRECVGVANGTDALELALRAIGVGPGGEVILPANTFIATAEAVSATGATPVLVDVDETHLLIEPNAVEKALTERTQAVIAVHLFGQCAHVDRIAPVAAAAGVPVVEDAAQAQGARRHGQFAGGLGRVAATSFYPGKNLGAAGDGGAVTTDDREVAARVRLLGAHGSREKYVHEEVGRNSRLDTIQAVYLSAKLARLEKWNELRRRAADRYGDLLADLPGVELPRTAEGNEDVWHLYTIRTERRDEVAEALAGDGIGWGIHYPTPVHLTRAYDHLGYGPGSFPVAEDAARRLLSLPMHPHLTAGQQERVAETLRRATAGHSRGVRNA